MNSKATKLEAFDRLLNIMDDLRAHCPWDQKQTFESLRHLTIEETYELGDAILDRNLSEIKKELGDLLLHIVFYAKLGSEEKAFDIADVANDICEKLIHRAEFGDVLFSLINYARFIKVNPESALERTNKKFLQRFQFIEVQAKKQDRSIEDLTLSEMESFWQEAKNQSPSDS